MSIFGSQLAALLQIGVGIIVAHICKKVLAHVAPAASLVKYEAAVVLQVRARHCRDAKDHPDQIFVRLPRDVLMCEPAGVVLPVLE